MNPSLNPFTFLTSSPPPSSISPPASYFSYPFFQSSFTHPPHRLLSTPIRIRTTGPYDLRDFLLCVVLGVLCDDYDAHAPDCIRLEDEDYEDEEEDH